MHQARAFCSPAATSEVLPAALTRLNIGMNGDARMASNPIAPADFLMKSRLFKPLPFSDT